MSARVLSTEADAMVEHWNEFNHLVVRVNQEKLLQPVFGHSQMMTNMRDVFTYMYPQGVTIHTIIFLELEHGN